MESHEIRRRFLAFFTEREHALVPSSSLVPNDPSLLLTNAGMNQFKPYFQGEQTAPYDRAVSVQKCFRTTDIDEVGATMRHLTFFEMLGNFSFGDYYKEKACPWAWELVTEGWGIDPERLWVTIFETDDEAEEVWRDGVGVAPGRIIRRGKEDNFWSMGVAGPCGPCSEIFVDRGDAYGDATGGPGEDEDRYMEIWNLVFMQNECDAAIEPVANLPTKNIDTGAGVERIAVILQDAPSVYDTDLLGGMVARAQALVGREYGKDAGIDRAVRILADHGRSLTFLIADGVLPSNEARGYVLRRIMRRVISQARRLGRDAPILGELIDASIELMGDAYPELRDRRDFMLEVVTTEEERFDATLRQGMTSLEGAIERSKAAADTEVAGDVAFRLHDSYGFPVELTKEVAAEAGLGLDEAGFEALMAEQRERARAARRSAADAPSLEPFGLDAQPEATEFIGFEHLTSDVVVVALSDGATGVPVATEGAEVDVILDPTPFYPEGGGQVGDRGELAGPSAAARVSGTHKVDGGVIVHRVKVTSGEIAVGDALVASVEGGARRSAERAHTATHILHWALRDRLGEHAQQAGSLVEPGRLRFDFNHFDALGDADLKELTAEIQGRVDTDDGVRAFETSFDYARSIGAMAIFGEKYGDFVRVVEVGEYSKELCGGTHVVHTSQIGAVVVTSEGSVGANLRRIEALVGDEGLGLLRRRAEAYDEVAAMLKVSPDAVAERVEKLLAAQKEMERHQAANRKGELESDAAELSERAEDLGGARLVVARQDIEVDALRTLARSVKGRIGTGIVVLGRAADGKANLVAAVSKDLAATGISARDLLAPGAALLGGGAGGKPDLAVSGGPAADRIDEAIEVVAKAARDAIRT